MFIESLVDETLAPKEGHCPLESELMRNDENCSHIKVQSFQDALLLEAEYPVDLVIGKGTLGGFA